MVYGEKEEVRQYSSNASFEYQGEKTSKQEAESVDIMKRRDVLRELAAIGFIIVTAPDELIDYQNTIQVPKLSGPSSFHEESLLFFEDDLTTRWELYYTGGPVRANRGLDLCIREITKLARLTQESNWHKRTLR